MHAVALGFGLGFVVATAIGGAAVIAYLGLRTLWSAFRVHAAAGAA
jgi:hypothetical protein